MTELHPKAKALIQLAKSGQSHGENDSTPSTRETFGQEPSAEELRVVLEGFQRRAGERSPARISPLHGRTHAQSRIAPKHLLNRQSLRGASSPSSWFEDFAHHYRRGLLKWSLLAAIMTGSLGAFANWGPREWREDLGQLADQVTQSIGELVVSVTGRGTSERARAPELAAPQKAAPASTDTPLGYTALGDTVLGDARAATSAPSGTEPNAARGASAVVAELGRSRLPASSARSTSPEPISPKSSATAPASMSSAARGPSGFSEVEVNLIAAARSALASGNYEQTRRLLDEHRTEFPRGALSEERETLRALVACRESGNTDLAQRYIQRRPQSLFAPRLIRECGLSTTPPPAVPRNDIP